MPSAIAQERLAARARRIRSLRQRIVASILATFVLAWGVVAFDGAMGAETTTVASTATTSAAATATPTSTDTTTSASQDTGSTLTTSQS
jgi:hypothetical protein